MKKKTKLIIGIAIAVILIFAFFIGENASKEQTPHNKTAQTQEEGGSKVTTPTEGNFCAISVRCDSVLEKLSDIKEEVVKIIPKDGTIYEAQNVKFEKGESAFDVLEREMKKSGIHIEFTTSPIYNTAYISGIGNLYEFDCGELSGWLYKVNGEFPDCSSFDYIVNSGDVIEFVYTCDSGRDI